MRLAQSKIKANYILGLDVLARVLFLETRRKGLHVLPIIDR